MKTLSFTGRTTRRRLLRSAALVGPGLALGGRNSEHVAAGVAVTQDATPEEPHVYAHVGAPAWSFTVHDYQDPYSGEVTRPEEPQPGTRYIGADVQIDNESDQLLSFERDKVRLYDDSGYEYKAGNTFGDAPALDGRTLNPGERARGWVWYTVSEESQISELVFFASSPQFRVPIDEK